MQSFRKALLSTAVSLTAFSCPLVAAAAPVSAQDPAQQTYHIRAQPLATALRAIALQSGQSVVAPAPLLEGKTGRAVSGPHSMAEALSALLAGTGLSATLVDGGWVVSADPDQDQTPAQTLASDVVVTGSKISGAKSPSPVITIRRDDMAAAGRTTVDDVIRTIPENFSGGQNPGVGYNVPETSGTNVGGSSSVNLRGLGSDATLTLLDGHRLAYSASFQSIDISAIPFNAIDRIEVVPDGGSALYGSDAVAGVVNVILRHDFTGLETSAKLGGATEGGDFLQQYGLTAGTTWNSGHAMLAYEFDRNGAITADQRDYTATLRPGLTLLPALWQHNIALVADQHLSPGLTFSVDALFGRRATDNHYPLNDAGDLSVSAAYLTSATHSFSIAPALDFDGAGSWHASLDGTYGTNTTSYGGYYLLSGTRVDAGAGYYRNAGSSVELNANGPLFSLPGGPAKIALGAGWRRNDFFRSTGSAVSDIRHAQDSYYGFGELSLPLLTPLTASAALRYEDYPGIGSVATPKLGAILSVSSDLDLKASWGKSFRAPTLYDQYQPQFGYLETAASLGGMGLPANATVLESLGGNRDLKPERSTNWSATIDLHPRAMRGFDLQLTYFSVDYTNRIVTPILFDSVALSNPIYASYVARSPNAATQAAFIANSATFTNLAGITYDPANVVAIVSNTSVNAGSQQARGVDLQMHYVSQAGPGTFHGTLAMSYLDSRQQLTADQPVTQLAGIVFNPPHLKGRAELGYISGSVSVTGDVNYIGPVRDTRAGLPTRIAGMTPVDFTVRYRTKSGGLLGGLDLILSAQNLFDEAPSIIATTLFYDTPYDSTNYSPVGRVLSLSVSKTW